MAVGPGGADGLSTTDVDAVRALMRRSDEASRCAGLETIDGWGDRRPDADAARSILRAATLAYPWVRSQRSDPALRFARLLCRHPRSVTADEVGNAYLVASEAVRRVLLHLLALRRDPAGVTAIADLLGPDGPGDLLPLPTGGLLEPALDVVTAADLAPALVWVAARPGWAWHAAEMLDRLVADGRLDDAAQAAVSSGLASVACELVDSVDRTHAMPMPAKDPTRADRFRLHALASLYRHLPVDGSAPVLRRLLASVDARVATMGAAGLLALGEPVAPERLDLIAREPDARADLLDALVELDELDRIAASWSGGHARAEAELVRWLACDTELGLRPDEVEPAGTVAAGEHPDDGVVHLFRFRLRSPHWSSARGWMIGAAGPYRDDGSVAEGFEPFASSIYAAEDSDEIDGHLDSILDSLGAWPEGDEA